MSRYSQAGVAKEYAKEPFTGSSTMTKTFNEPMIAFVITNDGTTDLDFVINKMVFRVKAGESFSEVFSPFTKVVIFTSAPFRAYGVNSIPSEPFTDSIIATDTFERTALGGKLGTASTGQTWEQYGSTASNSSWTIQNGQAMSTVTSYNTAVIDTGLSNYYSVEADIVMNANGSTPNYGGLMFSYLDYSNNLFFRGDSLNKIILFRTTTANTFARLNEVTFNFTEGQTIRFKVTRRGKNIEIFADGVSILTYTLTDTEDQATTGTKHGIFLKATNAAADNFKVQLLEV
ncbi:hypothetical protein [Priestia megaterium]|uniref:hypothetical protein n=1 Tax=Priestia megaterium TaxID=1404 RepID=UPI002E1A25E7|nr:hypothetical protein [Priestia megaterium]